MARFYFDHNVSQALAPLLEPDGHNVLVAGAVGQDRAPDDALLLQTVQDGRIFVTHNRKDFRMLHDAWQTWPAAFGMALPPHPGILVLDASPPSMLARALSGLLATAASDVLSNRLFWWNRLRGWHQPIRLSTWEPYDPGVTGGEGR